MAIPGSRSTHNWPAVQLVERLLFPAEFHPVRGRPEPDFGAIHLELRRKHVTLQLLWEECCTERPAGAPGPALRPPGMTHVSRLCQGW